MNWDGLAAMVRSGVADISIGSFAVTKERSEVVAFTDTLGFGT
jgi:ABC-type amino acid transport substrate-binding protein